MASLLPPVGSAPIYPNDQYPPNRLPKLHTLVMNGYIQYHNGDGRAYDWQQEVLQTVTPEMLRELFRNSSSLEVLDLSLTTVTSKELGEIKNAPYLHTLKLRGCTGVTDEGILALVERLPSLRHIDLSSVSLKEPMHSHTSVGPNISEALMQELTRRGITFS